MQILICKRWLVFALAVLSLIAMPFLSHATGCRTLEDLFGPTGDRWEAAIGLSVFQKVSPSSDDPIADFGLTIDDFNVEWKEVSLGDDNSDCITGGSCAVLDLDTFQFFEGNSLISITLLELSPSNNDCNDDGDNTDPGDDMDCNNDGNPDVRVNVNSEAEVEGEFVNLERTSASCNCEYRGQIAISVSYDVDPGVLFLAQFGTDAPTVTVSYNDLFDGVSGPCDNSILPEANGLVQVSTPVLIATGNVQVLDYALTDNGDNDGWADTNETVNMFLTIGNKTGISLTGLSAHLQTNNSVIDCIVSSFIEIGDIAAGETKVATVPFVFHVSPTADRTDVFDSYTAKFQVTLASDQLLAPTFPQSLTIDLDLSATGGSAPTTFFEGFEGSNGLGAFNQFSIDNLDEDLFGFSNSDGYRCQYSDPDYVNSASYGIDTDCHLGASSASAAALNWFINGSGSPNQGRGYSGQASLYYGINPDDVAADEQTTRLAALEAAGTTDPVNIGWENVCTTTRTTICAVDDDCPEGETCDSVSPTLSFKHQVSLMDSRSVNAPVGESADRAVVHVQMASSDGPGTPQGHWIKLFPFTNVYDQQGTDNFTNCLFDPIDDGNDEDDFFDFGDPNRRLGPSSTCFPELSFVFLGDTFEQNDFAELNIGNASDGPGLIGATGKGTWIESKFSLQRFRGRRIRTRFLVTSLKVGTTETYEAAFNFNPDPGDDGWWIDDVTITDTLVNAATVEVDGTDNSGLASCGTICNTVSAVLTAEPAGVLPAPGQVVVVTATDSVADRCIDGVLQYRFSLDGILIRDWTDNPDLLQAPTQTTDFAVDVRCSSDPSCMDSTTLQVVVDCPASGSLSALSAFQPIRSDAGTELNWTHPATGSFAKGSDAGLSSYIISAIGTVSGTSLDVTVDNPTVGTFVWYLIREGVFCNQVGSYDSAARDAALP